jgi:hypothetical protein
MKAIGHVSSMDIDTTHFNQESDSADLIHCTSCVMGKHKQLPFSTAA